MNASAAETFARNRAHGLVALEVALRDGVTRPSALREEGSLRVRFPTAMADQAEGVLINTAGGLAGGDYFAVRASVGQGASLALGTAAAEKVYRSLGPSTQVELTLRVGAGAKLAWLPQETILFDGAHLSRAVTIDLASNSAILAVEGLVFGRAARGETLTQGRVFDRWRVRRDGRLIFADALRLDGGIAQTLAQPASANGACAVATLLLSPGNESHVTAIREATETARGEVGASAWDGICFARFCAHNSAALRADLTAALHGLGARLPRSWVT
jgi:urease accessory protein